MAIARVTLTCKECGKEFEKTKRCRNTREAGEWEAWARDNVDTCPSCYFKAEREAEMAQSLSAEIRYKTATAFGREPLISFVFYGNTYANKDRIKLLGGKWSSDYPSEQGALGDILGMREPMKRWSVDCTADEFESVLAKVQEMTDDIKMPPQEQIVMFGELRKAYQAQKEKEQTEKAAAAAKKAEALGPEPQYDADIMELLDGKRWNGRFYGKTGRWRIYLSNVETTIDDDMKARMENTQAARAAWKKACNEI